MQRSYPPVSVFGVPTDIGASKRGASMGPEALRVAGLLEAIAARGVDAVSYTHLDVYKRQGQSLAQAGQAHGRHRRKGRAGCTAPQATIAGCGGRSCCAAAAGAIPVARWLAYDFGDGDTLSLIHI